MVNNNNGCVCVLTQNEDYCVLSKVMAPKICDRMCASAYFVRLWSEIQREVQHTRHANDDVIITVCMKMKMRGYEMAHGITWATFCLSKVEQMKCLRICVSQKSTPLFTIYHLKQFACGNFFLVFYFAHTFTSNTIHTSLSVISTERV